MTITPVRLHYEHTASPGESAYLRGLAEGRLLGQRCGVCGQVYIPPRGTCPADGVPTHDEVELPDIGTVTSFCIVNVGYPGQRVTPPYVAAAVLLDGADIAFQHLILGCDPSDVRMGMRVRAVWGGRRGASATSRRPGSRMRRTRPMRGTCDRGCGRRFRAVAVRRTRGRHHQRGGDAGADLRGGVRRHRADQGRHRVLVLGVLRLPGRAGVLLRVGGRRDRGGPADHGVARGDGRRVGAVRGLGEDPHRRGGDRAGLRVRQVVRRGAAARAGAATRPVPARPAVAGLGVGRGPAGAARPGGRAVDREGHGGGGRAQPGGGARQPAGAGVRGGRGRRPAGTALCGRTAAGARLRPGRRRGRGRDHRVRRAGPGSVRAARLDHRVRAPDRLGIAGRAGPAGGAVGGGRGPGGGSGGQRPGQRRSTWPRST